MTKDAKRKQNKLVDLRKDEHADPARTKFLSNPQSISPLAVQQTTPKYEEGVMTFRSS